MDAPRRPLRVVHLVQTLDVGGLERQVIELVLRTDPRVADTHILCLSAGVAMTEKYALAGRVTVIAARAGFDAAAVGRLATALRSRGAEILHCHNERAHYLGVPAALLAGVPIRINTRHGLYPSCSWRAMVRRRALAAATDRVIAVSRACRDEALAVDRISARKVDIIPNGTDLAATYRTRREARDLLGLAAGDFVVGALGRLVPEKDYGTLIEAFKAVSVRLPSLTGVVLGGGPLAAALEDKRRLEGCERLRFLGRRDDAVALLPAFDVLVQSSSTEGIALAVLEAMAARVPVIATSVGGMPEALAAGTAGILVPPSHPQAVADAIVALAGSPERRGELAEAGRRHVEAGYSIDATTRRYEALYLELARRRELIP